MKVRVTQKLWRERCWLALAEKIRSWTEISKFASRVGTGRGVVALLIIRVDEAPFHSPEKSV